MSKMSALAAGFHFPDKNKETTRKKEDNYITTTKETIEKHLECRLKLVLVIIIVGNLVLFLANIYKQESIPVL